jgi:hypothetical protein
MRDILWGYSMSKCTAGSQTAEKNSETLSLQGFEPVFEQVPWV